MPAYRAVKINVNSFFTVIPLPNGNVSGIGIIIRDHRGRIIRILVGTLGIAEQRTNELYAMLQGLIRAYWEHLDIVEMETDNVGAFWELENARTHGVPAEHEYVIGQLIRRREDDNQVLTISPVDEDANALARYLARYGAENFDRMVILEHDVGSIQELWSADMGLGPVGDRFVPIPAVELLGDAVDEQVVEDGVVEIPAAEF